MQEIQGDDDQIPVVLCFQGGGALGAFPAGAAIEIMSNPRLRLMGAVGTSSGAVSARALVNGYIHGMQSGDEQAARLSAIANLSLTWDQLIKYQGKAIPLLWYTTADYYFSHLPREIRQTFHDEAQAFAARNKSDAPLLDFYRFATRNNADLHPTCDAQHPFLAVNATRYIEGMNLWQAKPSDEIVIRLNGLTAEQQHRAVAASGCLDFMHPVNLFGDGKLFHDGAYSSPFPDPMGTAKLCAEKGYTMMVLRTRPEGSYKMGQPADQTQDDWKRAFFNTKMDVVLEQIRKAYPKLNLVVIEPDTIEHPGNGMMNAEMHFKRHRIAERFQDGQEIAARVIKQELGLRPSFGQVAVAPSNPTFVHPMFAAFVATAQIATLPWQIWGAAVRGATTGATREPDGIHHT